MPSTSREHVLHVDNLRKTNITGSPKTTDLAALLEETPKRDVAKQHLQAGVIVAIEPKLQNGEEDPMVHELFAMLAACTMQN